MAEIFPEGLSAAIIGMSGSALNTTACPRVGHEESPLVREPVSPDRR